MEDFSDKVHVGGTPSAPVTYGVGNENLEWYGEEGWAIEGGSEYSVSFGGPQCSESYTSHALDGYHVQDTFRSVYKTITTWRSRDNGDVCLKLGADLQNCFSNRAHYHETLVHRPASFVPEVRRVMFLGEGGSMILHEVMKYETLEVVVGLEGDKGPVQASFKHFDTLPHFDSDIVEWWFGDATLTLGLLPRDYLASFDLIIVDLPLSVIDSRGVMEHVRPYAHPLRGVMASNVNGGFATNVPFARHTVDLYDGDVPMFCHHTVAMGSDSVDFLAAERHVHDVENLYYDPKGAAEESTRFDSWYHYRKADEFDANEKIKSPGAPPSAGILTIIELEQVSAEGLWTDRITDALRNAGVHVTGVYPLGTKVIRQFGGGEGKDNLGKREKQFGGGEGKGSSVMFLAKEGYITVRAFPLERYCALDVLLWRDYQKTYDLEKSLASAFDCGVKSSYRIVTSGIYGATEYDDKAEEATGIEDSEIKGEKDSPSCRTGNDPTICKEGEKVESAVAEPPLALPVGELHAMAAMESALSSLKSPQAMIGVMLVLCGEDSQPCGAKEVAENFSAESGAAVSILRACHESQSVFACESNFRSTIRGIIERDKKVDAILIDSAAPMRSGRILHRILQRAKIRARVLSTNVFVAGVTTDPLLSTFWLRSLVDRFRTEFFPYNPSFHAEMIFGPPGLGEVVDGGSGGGEGLGVSLYSAGNYRFYSDLVRAVGEIEKTTGLSSDVRYVRGGLNNYVADFEPSQMFSREDYGGGIAAQEQRDSQMLLGRQSVVQYEAEAPPAKYGPASIELGLATLLLRMGLREGSYEIHGADVGEGCVVHASWLGGDATVVYDGRSRLVLDLFTLPGNNHGDFLRRFDRRMPPIVPRTRDAHPRGTDGAVTF